MAGGMGWYDSPMKKALLLGDSIRMGYDHHVRDLMAGTCDVRFHDTDNGRFAAYTLWQANQMWRHHGPFDVVHWNNGYWDMNIEPPMTEPIHPVDEYLHFLGRIIALIRGNGAQVIFATTLPILESGSSVDNTGTGVKLNYSNEWVKAYNGAAKDLMAKEGVPVNDLYALALTDPGYFKCEDRLHLTEAGYMACARQVAGKINEALG